jgi:hypothetical protein
VHAGAVDQGLAVDDEVVIGMGMAELSGSRFDSNQRYVGITTVFRGDGNCLLGHLSRDCSYDEYPQLLEQNGIPRLRYQFGNRRVVGWQTTLLGALVCGKDRIESSRRQLNVLELCEYADAHVWDRARGEGEACGHRLITRASPVKAGRYRDELASTTELGSYGGDLSTDRRALKLLHRLGKGTCSNGDADLGLHMPLDMRLGRSAIGLAPRKMKLAADLRVAIVDNTQ